MHGEQEGAAYNGHFGCVCYHQIFVFNRFGDCEGAMLRPGNVHSADNWRQVLAPILARYERMGVRRYFRADAAFAKPEVYQYLAERRGHASIAVTMDIYSHVTPGLQEAAAVRFDEALTADSAHRERVAS